jgi:Protein of unknown function (DUF1156)
MTAQTVEVVHRPTKVKLVPLALKDAPALIEIVFPAQKVSFEAQRERKAGSGQTLTALGSYANHWSWCAQLCSAAFCRKQTTLKRTSNFSKR